MADHGSERAPAPGSELLELGAQNPRPVYEIVAGQTTAGRWTARCYRPNGEHVWSSEDASSARQALRELARAIEEDRS